MGSIHGDWKRQMNRVGCIGCVVVCIGYVGVSTQCVRAPAVQVGAMVGKDQGPEMGPERSILEGAGEIASSVWGHPDQGQGA